MWGCEWGGGGGGGNAWRGVTVAVRVQRAPAALFTLEFTIVAMKSHSWYCKGGGGSGEGVGGRVGGMAEGIIGNRKGRGRV
jgi:hypothetical protein